MDEYINKIIHADCLEVLKSLPDKCIDLVVTSPPYNLGITYNSYDDNLQHDEYVSWCDKWISACCRAMKSGGRIAINIPLDTSIGGKKFICNDYMNLCKKYNLLEKAFILWDKNNVASRTAWGSYCSPSNPNIIQPMECILVYAKDSCKKDGDSDMIGIDAESFIRNSIGVWKMRPQTNSKHPAPFPYELPKRVIEMFTYKEDIVLDPFSGSGTTAVACHNLNRRFICIEKDKEYYDASVKRLKDAQSQILLTNVNKTERPKEVKMINDIDEMELF